MSQWLNAGEGAAGGVMTGASMGSALGPWGALVGAGVGGVLGGVGGYYGPQGSQSYEDKLKKLYEKYASMGAPQMGSAAQGTMSAFRQNQAALIAQLEALGRGEGPSAATIQMREAMDRAAGAQASAAAGAGGRGVNAGAAYRNAANNTAAIQAQGARDTATLRAQEQFNALQQLGNVVGQGRAADEGMSRFNAEQTNQVAQANLEAQLRHLGITSQVQLQALMAAMGVAGPGFGASLMAGGATAYPKAMERLDGLRKEKEEAQREQLMQGAFMQQSYPSPGPVSSPSGWGQYYNPAGRV